MTDEAKTGRLTRSEIDALQEGDQVWIIRDRRACHATVRDRSSRPYPLYTLFPELLIENGEIILTSEMFHDESSAIERLRPDIWKMIEDRKRILSDAEEKLREIDARIAQLKEKMYGSNAATLSKGVEKQNG